MGAPKRKTAQADAIDAILATEKTVVVHGTPLVLTVPKAAVARKLRKLQFSLAPKDGVEPDMETLAETSLRLASEAVAACLGDLDGERAARLVLASGGEMGELSRAALDLCGIGVGAQRALSQEDDGDHPI